MNIKSDKERKDTLINVRVNEGERESLERLSEETGFTYAEMFRMRIMGLPENIQVAMISNSHEMITTLERADLSNSEKMKLIRGCVARELKILESEIRKRRKAG